MLSEKWKGIVRRGIWIFAVFFLLCIAVLAFSWVSQRLEVLRLGPLPLGPLVGLLVSIGLVLGCFWLLTHTKLGKRINTDWLLKISERYLQSLPKGRLWLVLELFDSVPLVGFVIKLQKRRDLEASTVEKLYHTLEYYKIEFEESRIKTIAADIPWDGEAIDYCAGKIAQDMRESGHKLVSCEGCEELGRAFAVLCAERAQPEGVALRSESDATLRTLACILILSERLQVREGGREYFAPIAGNEYVELLSLRLRSLRALKLEDFVGELRDDVYENSSLAEGMQSTLDFYQLGRLEEVEWKRILDSLLASRRPQEHQRSRRCARMVAERLSQDNKQISIQLLTLLYRERNGVVPCNRPGTKELRSELAKKLVASGRILPDQLDSDEVDDIGIVEQRLRTPGAFAFDRFKRELKGDFFANYRSAQRLASPFDLYALGERYGALDEESVAKRLLTREGLEDVDMRLDACVQKVSEIRLEVIEKELSDSSSDIEALLGILERHRIGPPSEVTALAVRLKKMNPERRVTLCLGELRSSLELERQLLVLLTHEQEASLDQHPSQLDGRLREALAWVLLRSGKLLSDHLSTADLELVERRLQSFERPFDFKSFKQELKRDFYAIRSALEQLSSIFESYRLARFSEIGAVDEEVRRRVAKELLQQAGQPPTLESCAGALATVEREMLECKLRRSGSLTEELERIIERARPLLSRKRIERLTARVGKPLTKRRLDKWIERCVDDLASGLDVLGQVIVLLASDQGVVTTGSRPPTDCVYRALSHVLVGSGQLPSEGFDPSAVERLLRSFSSFRVDDLRVAMKELAQLRSTAVAYLAFLAGNGLAQADATVDTYSMVQVRDGDKPGLPRDPQLAVLVDVGESAMREALRARADQVDGQATAAALAAATGTEELRCHCLLAMILHCAGTPNRKPMRRLACAELSATARHVLPDGAFEAPLGVRIAWSYLLMKQELARGAEGGRVPQLAEVTSIWRRRFKQSCKELGDDLRHELERLEESLADGVWLESRGEVARLIGAVEESAPESPEAVEPEVAARRISETEGPLKELFTRLELGSIERHVAAKGLLLYLLAFRARPGSGISRYVDRLQKLDPEKYNLRDYTPHTRIGIVPPGISFADFCEDFKKDFEGIVRVTSRSAKTGVKEMDYEILIHAIFPTLPNPFGFGKPPGRRPAIQNLKQLFAGRLERDELCRVLRKEGWFERDTRVDLLGVLLNTEFPWNDEERSVAAGAERRIKHDFSKWLGNSERGLERLLEDDRLRVVQTLASEIAERVPSLPDQRSEEIATSFLQQVEAFDRGLRRLERVVGRADLASARA